MSRSVSVLNLGNMERKKDRERQTYRQKVLRKTIEGRKYEAKR
jgi:hypothetical protein